MVNDGGLSEMPAASTRDALPRAQPGDVIAAASVISHPFGWERKTGTGSRPTPSWQERLRTGLRMPVTLLVELFSVHNRQLYYRLGVVLSVNPITTGKRLRYAGLAVLGIAILPAGLLLTARLSYRLALLLGNVLFVALLVVLLVLGVGLAAMHWGSAANRRASKKAGYTTSKKSRDGESFPPPKAPTWKTGNLAADPRRKQLGGFHTATATLTAVVPSGEVVEGTAASPHHVLAYQRAGFVQWHKKSLAMWKLMP